MKRLYVYILLLVVFTVSIGFYLYNFKTKNNEVVDDEDSVNLNILKGQEMVVYKSPTCPCCDGYIDGLRKIGVNVKVLSNDIELQKIKNKYGIEGNKQSCHTTIVGKYFVEGHVPFEVIAKLIKDKPNIKGITLPGMPVGVPGMPGKKRGIYDILAKDSNDNYYIYYSY